MKGLLIKDFLLLKGQKKFYLVVIGFALLIAVFTENPAFLIGYLIMLLPTFSFSSISYDEFDHGNAFLFALPVTRREYVMEKYLFAILLGMIAWGVAVPIALLFNRFRPITTPMELIIAATVIFGTMLVMQSLMLPLQLKFGAEKGRIAMLTTIGALLALGYLLMQLWERNGELFQKRITDLGIFPLLLVGILLLIGLLLASVKISTVILEKKEF